MLNRRARHGLIGIALMSALLAACQQKILTPTELEAVQTSSDAYLAYERGDCQTTRRLTDPTQLNVWPYNEMRHSMLLLQGFCREIEGNPDDARDIYRQLILEAPNSFASDDAVERTRVLNLIENDPAYAQRVISARERVDPLKPRRTPIERGPVEFPPLAKAAGIDGYVVVEFGITRRGDTEKAIVVESSPPLLFDGVALRAVRRWKYLHKPATLSDDRQLIRILFRRDAPPESIAEDAAGVPGIQ